MIIDIAISILYFAMLLDRIMQQKGIIQFTKNPKIRENALYVKAYNSSLPCVL